ncbi:MAG: hypothetical protein IJ911_08070 [Salinivirgaceae bacterium]|nr:hypothetical protein [Salinivirgaceae bacterium]
MKQLTLILIPIALLAACDKSDSYQLPPVEKIECQYFPLDSGAWRDFDVVEIKIDEPIALFDTQQYIVRERFGGIFIDNVGDTLRQIERFRRASENEKWQPMNTWLAYVNGTEVIQIEENTRIVKMQLPLAVGKTWNGNAYNRTDTLQKYQFRVDSIDSPAVVGRFRFDSVLTVSQKNELTAISKVLVAERYAAGIGMVEKVQIDIYSDSYAPNIDIENRVTQGTMIYLTLIDFGK